VTPAVDPQIQARQARARIAVFITTGAMGASAALSSAGFGAWRWVPWVLGLILIIFFTATAMAGSGDRRGGQGKGIGLGWRGLDDEAPAGPAAHQWPALLVVSRAMPPAAAHRWRAEAESVLAEIAAARRGAALRGYVRSAPRLMVMMWAHEVLRRVRPGSRHPR
jgi:hypothetical protein